MALSGPVVVSRLSALTMALTAMAWLLPNQERVRQDTELAHVEQKKEDTGGDGCSAAAGGVRGNR
jgi:hypothetical protein